MLIDKLESYTIHIAELNRRKNRTQLSRLLQHVNLPSSLKYEFTKVQKTYLLRVHIQKLALPYLLSFLGFHYYTVYQVIRTKFEHELIPFDQLALTERRFEFYIDGLTDPFIKDKVIDVLHHGTKLQLKYTVRKNILTLTCTLEEAGTTLSLLSRHHIDIYQAYAPLQPHAHIIRIS
ncbi:hypothetical protein [Staphylococcus hyicus]|uniref:hypothetical protein n=1 Tax=Staphylococcus hyicus TaxID=1284 RepID=UPI00208E75ED|nr:hypothetical protein [Staphylococcus hyicus]MCO4331045.1 hypothetical protein [Staphylococcus hyicus]MCO4333342.1 hypothetical protein [Staphylococcus hyicus]